MKTLKSLLILLTTMVCLFILNGRLSAQSAAELYEKAIYAEEAKGDLQEAIKIFTWVVENRNTDQSVRVKAMLHLGMCYEKQGSEKAGQTYRQLIKEYPGNSEEVFLAKDRLANIERILSGMKSKPTFRKIEIATKPQNGVLSPDGKKLAFTSGNSVWVVPLQGNVRTNIAGEPERIAEVQGAKDLDWSANGKFITVNSRYNNEDTVHIISTKGGEVRKIKMPERTSTSVSLSPDGEQLAFVGLITDINKQNGRWSNLRINLISTKGGESRQISPGPGNNPSFSPDGKHIAYVNNMEKKDPPKDGKGTITDSELWIINSSGDSPIRLVVEDGFMGNPVWSPDGRFIAAKTRVELGAMEITVYPLSADASHVGEASVITLPRYSSGGLSGWTPSNEIGIFILSELHSAAYTVSSSGGMATQISPDANVYYPRWSPDGKRIYMRLVNDEEDPSVQIVHIPAAGGSISKVSWPENPLMSAVPGGGHVISPDGRKMVVSAKEKPYLPDMFLDLYLIPMGGSQPVRLTNNESFEMYPCWSPDGKWIAFVEWHKSSDVKGFDAIYKIPAGGGEPVQITFANDTIGRGSIAFTPDGKQIAFFSNGAIRTIPIEGGKSEVLLSSVKFDHKSRIAWSPDGSKLAYNSNGKVWITTLATGEKTGLKTGLPENYSVEDFDWSPDGRKITFKSSTGMEPEFWLVSNFLPVEKQARKKSSVEEREVVIRQIWAEGFGDFSVSANGEFLTCIDEATGNLAFRNLRTGEIKSVTNDGSYKFENSNDTIQYPEFSLISPDGKQVAYLWSKWFNRKPTNELKPTRELRIIRVGSFKPVTLYTCKEDELLSPELWLSDGKRIIVQKEDSRNKVWQLYMVDITNGEFRLLKENDSGNWSNLALSPDEKHIAFDFPIPSGGGKYDIMLLQIDTRIESALIENPANDRLIGWMPGTNKLLFTSDRSGTNDLWAVTVSGDGANGLPTRILNNTGNLNPIGFTSSGSLYFSQSTNKYEAFIVPLDSEKGKLTINSRKPLPGQVSDVCWLPDGESLILVQKTQQQEDRMSSKLIVFNTKTGESRSIAGNLDILTQSRLSPDGKAILAFGWDNQKNNDKNYRGGIYFIDIETGLPTGIKVSQKVFPSGVEWDKGGENIFYPGNKQIIKHNISTGEEKTLFTDEHPYFFPTLRLSSDGHHLLFNTGGITMLSVPEDGGEAKTIYKYGMLDARFIRISVSPDGKYIYFTAGEPGFKSLLCRIPSSGGTPETLWQSRNQLIGGISIQPGGKQIALSVWESGKEIRAIENLDKKVAEIFRKQE